MTDAVSEKAKNLVAYIEGQRSIIKEAQDGYRSAKTANEKEEVIKRFLTRKSELTASLPNKTENCLFSIGTGTATILTTVTVTAG